MNHLKSIRTRADGSSRCQGSAKPSNPVSSSFTARAVQPQAKAMVSTIIPAPARVYGHGASLTGHAINSSLGRLVVLTIRRLVASNSTCCASLQASSHSLAEKLAGWARGRFHWRSSLSRLPAESKGFLGVSSTKCSRCNTASLSCDITTYADSGAVHARIFRS